MGVTSPPLSLAYLATVARNEEHKVKIIDSMALIILIYRKQDILGFLFNLRIFKLKFLPSKKISLLSVGWPYFVNIFIASNASNDPMIPSIGPNIGNISLLSIFCGNMH